MAKTATVYVVDDDLSVRKGLARLIKSVGYRVMTFASAKAYLKNTPCEGPSCLVLDVRMPEISGIDLQKRLASSTLDLPVIFITGHGTVPMSVKALKAGAVDFIEKPFDEQTLLDAISAAIERDKAAKQERADILKIKKNLGSLTPRENEVFHLVVQGRLNKQIAAETGTSEKTVKVHRARVMKKMQADSLADLVRMATKVDH